MTHDLYNKIRFRTLPCMPADNQRPSLLKYSISRYQTQPRGTNTRRLVATDDTPDKPSGTIYCDSFECSVGYVPMDNAANRECKNGVCTESRCCDMVCSSFECPPEYVPVENSNTTVCRSSGCTEKRCCEMGERHREDVASVWREYRIYFQCSVRLK